MTPPALTPRDYLIAHAPITLADALACCRRGGEPEPTTALALQTLAQLRVAYADEQLKAKGDCQ